jgi:hypothetical protein
MSEEIFHIVAENPEKEHVPGEVQESGMEKHAGHQGHEGSFKTGVSHQESRETSGNRGVREEQGFIGPVRERSLEAELVNKHSDVGKDKCDVDEGIGSRRVEVLEWNEHGKRPAAE